MAEPAIQKVYETVPAYEQIKIYVVTILTKLNEIHAMMQKNMLMGRQDNDLKNRFKADVLNFYIFLRPKIYDYSMSVTDNEIKQTYDSFIKTMNFYVMRPKKFDLSTAMYAYMNILQFCEDYRLTATTYWSGGTKGGNTGGDIMNV